MMFFSKFLPAAGFVAALAFGVIAQQSSDTIGAIQLVTSTAANVGKDIDRVNSGNIGHEGESIAEGINNLSADINDILQNVFLDAPQKNPYGDKTAQRVIDVLTRNNGLVSVFQNLLNTIMNQHELAVQYALGHDIGEAVRSFRASAEEFLGAVLALVPSQAKAGNAAFENVEDYLEAAVAMYES